MIQLRPTFSESWYRVAGLRARLRSSAQISRQFYRGERWYVVRDPAGNQFHRLSDAAYRFIGLLDGTRTVEQAWDICGGQLADDAPTQPEIIQILSHLYAANLIEADVTPDATVLLRRHKQLTKRKMQNRFMNVLFPRLPIWDPDTFLVRWLPVMRVVFSWAGAALWVIVVLAALARVGPMWGELEAGAKSAIDPSNWLWLWAVFVAIKAIHELGHAFACRRFGGECHELGIMFLVFVPTPYVDASAAWAFPSRWQRMFVGAAGMIVELFVASVLAICWSFIPNHATLVSQLMYNAMLIASVSTLMFNANPLLRYDGYYILSDFLEIPNLRQKSTEYAMGLVKRHIFGVKATQPLPPVGQRFWLFSYAVASSIYRIFVGFLIVLIVAYKIPILGMLMAVGGVATWLFVPVGKLAKYLMLEPELHRKRTRATAFCLAVGACAILAIGVIPFNVYVDATGVAKPTDEQVVHAKADGIVTWVLPNGDGQQVRLGQTILVCRDPKVEAEIGRLQSDLAAEQAQLVEARAIEPSAVGPIESQMDATRREIEDARRRLAELTVVAPISGTLVAPHLAELTGSTLQRSTEVATVASVDSLDVWAVTDQSDHELVARQERPLLAAEPARDTGPVQVCFAGDLAHPQPGKVTLISAGVMSELPSNVLTTAGGGSIAPDPADPKGMTPLVRQFQVQVRVTNPAASDPTAGGGQPIYPGQVAYVRLKVDRKPLIYTWTRRLLQLLQSHENDSKLT